MRVFVTGATGFIGSQVVEELIRSGHQVLGLCRSDPKGLTAAGAAIHRGRLEDLDSLRSGAALADGVIHCAFVHDFARMKESLELDRRVIAALGEAGHPMVVTSAAGFSADGRTRTEEDAAPPAAPRSGSDEASQALAAHGARVSVVRLPQVHSRVKQGLATPMRAIARQKGVSAYVGEGKNRWPAVHLLDVAPVYRLALEKGVAGANYHAVAEEGVTFKEIAEAIGRSLKVPVVSLPPEQAAEHFGGMAFFAGMDAPTSSALTRQRLGWTPTQTIGYLEDIELAST